MSAPPHDHSAQQVLTGLAKIGLALKVHAWQTSGPQGLTPTQGQILTLLQARAPRALNEVASELGVGAATVSEAVTTLVRKRLVQKTRAPHDRRQLVLLLTARGRRVATRIAGWPDFLLHAIHLLSGEERGVLLRTLVKIIRTLQERRQIPVARMCVTCRFFRPNVYPGSERPHHCAFVDAPFGDHELRLECRDHQPADLPAAAAQWAAFCGRSPPESDLAPS
ncbi:MAG: MarR family winged helix-turn-helix transcriptional regulator [Candidatus Binatia bacterium]|nr:MarR family winged helix-turn-helix transcriptional regulator [Candidatus Binatia bacterium]